MNKTIIAAGLALIALVSDVMAGTIVQWGAPGGATNIVTANQDFAVKTVTYTAGTAANPAVGSAYYPNAIGRSPVFNHASSTTTNAKAVQDDNTNGDCIATAKNQASYQAMVAWEQFLTTDNILTSLSMEIRVSDTVAASTFRWLVQKQTGGAWYASGPVDFNSSYLTYSTPNPAGLTWYSFTPVNNGSAVIGSTPVTIDMMDIKSVGFWAIFTNTTGNPYRAIQMRYFQAKAAPPPDPPEKFKSIDTGYTIQKVRTARKSDGTTFIVGSSYEGTLLGVGFDGAILWTNPLSGYMNHDVWCEDINADGTDEILAANADGSIYCLSAAGVTQWQFKPNNGGALPPMYAVCVIHDAGNQAFVVCGGYDKNLYYLAGKNGTVVSGTTYNAGALVKTIASSTYSTSKPWGADQWVGFAHNANFLRKSVQADGSEDLILLGTMNHMQSNGVIYQFDPLATVPFKKTTVVSPEVIGDLRVIDPDGDGVNEILLGTSALSDQGMVKFDPVGATFLPYLLTNIGTNGYRVTQVETIQDGASFKYFMLCGSTLLLGTPSFDSTVVGSVEKLTCKYAFNDMWKDPASQRIILASAQSGGSCVHVIDTRHSTWKTDFANLNPPGKIATILANTAAVRTSLSTFARPAWERAPVPVIETQADPNHAVAQSIKANYSSPIFLKNSSYSRVQDPLDWDRNTILASNPVYRDKRDTRNAYDLTQTTIVNTITATYAGNPGIAYWGGHGNDPYYYSPETTRAVINFGAAAGKRTVLIWPEMNGSGAEFEMVMNHLFYPMAEYARPRNTRIYIRNKNVFWQGAFYLPAWDRMRNGEFADVFTSGMEETTDKTMELSVVGRMGIWASGGLDSWGMRCSRDNPSFDRQRQHSYQRLPNHFLRNMVYNLAAGATYLNVTYVDADYMSLAWELVAKGALFVPKRNEIVSFSPVHLGMRAPDARYLDDGENNKWTTFYNRTFEENNSYVFSRMNGTWPAAPNTAWDFSRYAAGVKDRRQNFLPPYKNGTVLITPPQKGVFANTSAARGKMTSYLHPMYKNLMTEFITDGHNYYSSDGTATYAANTYYPTVENAITNGANQLPVTVSGDVAWVCAQTSPTHLRLTLIDSGYLDPKARTATVSFKTVTPVAMRDVLNSESFSVSNPASVAVTVPLGMFRFIDIELDKPFWPSWSQFVSYYGLSGSFSADSDQDGQSDGLEFALGGNPNNPGDNGLSPTVSYDPVAARTSFRTRERSDTQAGISILAQWSTNLLEGSWSSVWSRTISLPITDPAFRETEYQLDGEQPSQLFMRLKVTQP